MSAYRGRRRAERAGAEELLLTLLLAFLAVMSNMQARTHRLTDTLPRIVTQEASDASSEEGVITITLLPTGWITLRGNDNKEVSFESLVASGPSPERDCNGNTMAWVKGELKRMLGPSPTGIQPIDLAGAARAPYCAFLQTRKAFEELVNEHSQLTLNVNLRYNRGDK